MKSFFTCIALLVASIVCANDIQIDNVQLLYRTVPDQTITIAYDVSWSNSWRNNLIQNHDAAYIYVNITDTSSISGAMPPAKPDYADFPIVTVLAGSQAVQPEIAIYNTSVNQHRGILLRFANGNNDYQGANVKAHVVETLDVSGLTNFTNSSAISIRVQALEMVYIPEEQFFLTGYTDTNTGSPAIIDSEAPRTLGKNALSSGQDLSFQANSVELVNTLINSPAAFPKGFESFYVMKHELSNEAYFLTTSGEPFHAYAGSGGLNTMMTRTGLRPMTEFEYEKICRGPVQPVLNENASGIWDDGVTIQQFNQFNTEYEAPAISIPQHRTGAWQNVKKADFTPYPIGDYLRTGAFATSNSNRVSAGASYYGVLDMTANAPETCIRATIYTSFTRLTQPPLPSNSNNYVIRGGLMYLEGTNRVMDRRNSSGGGVRLILNVMP